MAPKPKDKKLRLALSFDEKMEALTYLNKRGLSKRDVERMFNIPVNTFDYVINHTAVDAWLEKQLSDAKDAGINSSFFPKTNDVTEQELIDLNWRTRYRLCDVLKEATNHMKEYLTGK